MLPPVLPWSMDLVSNTQPVKQQSSTLVPLPCHHVSMTEIIVPETETVPMEPVFVKEKEALTSLVLLATSQSTHHHFPVPTSLESSIVPIVLQRPPSSDFSAHGAQIPLTHSDNSPPENVSKITPVETVPSTLVSLHLHLFLPNVLTTAPTTEFA